MEANHMLQAMNKKEKQSNGTDERSLSATCQPGENGIKVVKEVADAAGS